MPDYKAMYQRLFYATEDAISLLIRAQQECGELYINSAEAEDEELTAEEEFAAEEEEKGHRSGE
ncbi:MAG: hypothetical protein Q4B50_01505 [Bacillota bacterium]|nr:hypothetical protein [Bacillota bacterium]